MDAVDPLARFQDAFVSAEPDMVYLDGNSLGRLPVRTVARLRKVAEVEWGRDLIRSWNEGWYEAPTRVGEKIALLVGAEPGQVVVSDSTSVNLFKLTMAALDLRPNRSRIVTDAFNFPTDLYVLQGCVRLLGERHRLEVVPSRDGVTIEDHDILTAIDEETALVSLSHVAFKSGFLHNARTVTERAHEVGALVLWDLSHSVGAVPVNLDGWAADLAVGCTYKYLNGGPGAPAFLYVARELQETALSPIWGWFGQHRPFDFDMDYEPTAGVARFLAGSPPILSLLAMESALELILDAGMDAIRAKSVQLTSYLIFLVDQVLSLRGVELGTPRDSERRGSQVSVRHPEAYRICRTLIEDMDVIPDFREPDNIRLGLSPLYTSYTQVREAVERIRHTIDAERYQRYGTERRTVT
jgi:kynureninase